MLIEINYNEKKKEMIITKTCFFRILINWQVILCRLIIFANKN